MAEALFKSILKEKNETDIICTSAGVTALNGSPANENAIKALCELNLDLSSHRAKDISKVELKTVDLFAVMSISHAEILKSLKITAEKIYVLGNQISDPFGGNIEVYRKCRDEIVLALQDLYEFIKNEYGS